MTSANIHCEKTTAATSRSPFPNRGSKAKVLHLINGEHFSGAERVQDLLAQALPPFGYEVEFVCLKPKKFPAARQSTCPLRELPMRSRLDWRCIRQLVELIGKHQFRIIHAHTPRTLLMAKLALSRLRSVSPTCKLVYHVHSPVGLDSNRSLTNRINTWTESWSLRRADQMICVSNSLHRYMLKLGFLPDKIAVVPNGVPVIDNLPARSVPGKIWTIGTMALFRPRKGTEVLLEAVKMLRDRNIPVNVRAVGPFETPQYEQEILSLVQRIGISEMIEWVGFQTDVNAQLQKMDLFVLPSLYGEGLPMVVLEAMANGVPVVASNVEGIPEAVRDGIDGRIFEPNNPKDLFVKLAKSIGRVDRWQEMRQSCIQRQRSQLSEVSMAEGVSKVYDRVLGIAADQAAEPSGSLPMIRTEVGLASPIQSQVFS